MARTILLYGGSGGIGEALARRLAAAGDRVHLVARDAGRLERLAGEIGAGWTAGDVRDEGLGVRVLADLGDGAIDGLAYAVGTITLKPLGRLTAADFLDDYAINVVGAAAAIRTAAPRLAAAADGGSVVLFSSVAARQGFAAHASIGAAKSGVEGLALALAAELAPKIRVNVVAPSLTATPLAAAITANEPMTKAIAALHALGRIGAADDSAAAADFLLSKAASFMTGQVLGVDGGRSTLRTKG